MYQDINFTENLTRMFFFYHRRTYKNLFEKRHCQMHTLIYYKLFHKHLKYLKAKFVQKRKITTVIQKHVIYEF